MKAIFGVCAVLLSIAAISAARPLSNSYIVVGPVYCDTCRAGFETPLTSYIADAKVRVECRRRDSSEVLYSVEGATDSTGWYSIPVNHDQGDRVCDAVLISSPLRGCGKADPGRDRSRVILTDNNGMTSTKRFANALGFMQEHTLGACTDVMQQYQLNEEDN